MHYSTLRIVFAKIIMKTLDNKYQTVFRAKWLYQNVHRLQIQSVKSYSSEPCFKCEAFARSISTHQTIRG